MFRKDLIFLKRFYPKNSLLTGEFIDLSFCNIKRIHKGNRIILWMNMTNKEKLKVTRADPKIKALMRVKDQHSQEAPNFQKKVAYQKIDHYSSFI
jgi:hypothetical protein